MKYLALIALLLSFSTNAFAWFKTNSTWYGGTPTWQKPTYCSTKPVTIQTACDLKSYAASPAGSTAFGFYQGYVVSAFRTLKPRNPVCIYSGTDQQAISAATTYLSTVTTQKCPTISATDAMHNAFEAASLVFCSDLP
jgi:hypothetical protein